MFILVPCSNGDCLFFSSSKYNERDLKDAHGYIVFYFILLACALLPWLFILGFFFTSIFVMTWNADK